MKNLKMLSREEMRKINAGGNGPACLTGKPCFTVPNGVCAGSAGKICFCSSTTNGTQSGDASCSGGNA